MDTGNDKNAERGSHDPGDSPLRRRIMQNAQSATPARDLPRDRPLKPRPKPEDTRPSIGPWDLVPIMIMVVVGWLWLLDIVPSPFASLSSDKAAGADANSDIWAMASGLFLVLGAGYLFWLGRRLSGLGRYKSPTYPADDGSFSPRRRKTLSGRILRYLAFAMVLKAILMLWTWGSSD